MSKNLILYTRDPMDSDIYDPKLAYSMHLAFKTEDGYLPLNHNSGVFFAKATENEDGSINPKSLKAPYAFKLADGGYGIVSIRTEADGSPDTQDIGSVLIAVTQDFLHYKEVGTVKISDTYVDKVAAKYCENGKAYKICFYSASEKKAFKLSDLYGLCGMPVNACAGEAHCELEEPEIEGTGIEGAHTTCQIEIPDEIADKLMKKLITPVNVAINVPDETEVHCPGCIANIKAEAVYSDGSKDEKRVDWDISSVDFQKPGRYEITGLVHQDHYEFPIAENRADPCIAKWQDKFYFIATDDSSHEQNIYIRCADSIPELVTAPEHLILDNKTYPDIGGLLWAPELHEICGRLYIFHAATPGPFFNEESHIMVLREGGDPTNRDDWSRPKRVTRADGSDIAEAGKTITLDMTTFNWNGEDYVVWSHRQFIPKDLGAWLYIAKLDPSDPFKLASEPIVLSKPDYGWANNHTLVDEGPFALFRDGKLWLSFSSAAVDTTYVVAFLTLEAGKDPLVISNWVKANYPSMTSRCVEGEFGTGHNAYVIDDDGKVFNTYHARPGMKAPRSAGIRRVHFNVYNEPVLDMTEEMDIKPELKKVKTTVIVK